MGDKFAALTEYHATFRSCNKAFIIDRQRRLDHWCGTCDKCCFIDLILAPFMSAEQLRAVFAADGGGGEPLDNPELAPKFEALLGSGTKPFECVGEVNECRAAVVLAARRPDRAGTPLLQKLAAEINGAARRADRGRDRGHAPPGRRELRAGRRWPPSGPEPTWQLATSEPGDVRPTLGWSDLRGARVGVWGLGREGSASLRKLRALGVEPVLVDDNPTEPGVRATADGGLDALETCEIVIKTPGISPYGPEAVRLRQAGVILVGGLGLWLQEADRDAGGLRHRDQGQVDHLVRHRPPAGRPRLPGAGRRQLRRRPL